jgi:hypothetical protein
MEGYDTLLDDQAAMSAEAVFALLNYNKNTISTCWEDVEFFCNNEPIYESLIQSESICTWHLCPCDISPSDDGCSLPS